MIYLHVHILSIPIGALTSKVTDWANETAEHNRQELPHVHPELIRMYQTSANLLCQQQIARLAIVAVATYLRDVGCAPQRNQLDLRAGITTLFPDSYYGQAKQNRYGHELYPCNISNTHVEITICCNREHVDIFANMPRIRCGFMWMRTSTDPLLTAVVSGHLAASVPAIRRAIMTCEVEGSSYMPKGWCAQQQPHFNMDNIETPRSTTRKTIGEELTKFGWSELRCGHHDKTWKAFTAAHKENIEDAEAWKGLGWVALRERQWVQAAGCFAVVIQLRPDDSEAIFCHAKSVDMAGGESLCALESYERFLMCSQANRNADIIEMRKEAQQRIMELDRGQ